MSTTPINIDAGAMQSIVSKAILEGIDADQRSALLEQAVTYLIAPSTIKGQYGRDEQGPTPLERAFRGAIDGALITAARELVDTDEQLRGRIQELLTAAVADVLSKDNTSLATAVRSALGAAIAEFQQGRY